MIHYKAFLRITQAADMFDCHIRLSREWVQPAVCRVVPCPAAHGYRVAMVSNMRDQRGNPIRDPTEFWAVEGPTFDEVVDRAFETMLAHIRRSKRYAKKALALMTHVPEPEGFTVTQKDIEEGLLTRSKTSRRKRP